MPSSSSPAPCFVFILLVTDFTSGINKYLQEKVFVSAYSHMQSHACTLQVEANGAYMHAFSLFYLMFSYRIERKEGLRSGDNVLN